MRGRSRGRGYLFCFFTVVAVFFLFQLSLYAEVNTKGDESTPSRLVTLAVEYPGIEVTQGQNINMNIILHNRGKQDENVQVWLSRVPKGWNAQIKTYQYNIRAVNVPASKDKSLNFEAKPPEKIKPGNYLFRVEAKTDDGKFMMAQNISVLVKAAEQVKQEKKGVKLNTSYPVLEGPVKGKFEFSIDVQSELDNDAVFDLIAQGPEGWDIRFKPAYESKYISSLQLKAGQSSKISVEVNPVSMAVPGEYPIGIRAQTGKVMGETSLKVVLTGSYELKVGTTSGLLSLDARPGKPANVSLYVKNTGTAMNNNITFMSFKPENWKVEFKPDRIDTLEPDELKQIEVIITPYDEALVGDYSVSLEARGEKDTSDSKEFRVTVKASSTWGWIGIAIIIVVIGGLVVLFRFVGRR